MLAVFLDVIYSATRHSLTKQLINQEEAMCTTNSIKLFISLLLSSLLLVACGGSKPAGEGGGGGTPQTQDTTIPAKFGYGSGSNFESGKINIGIGSDTLSAGGTVSLTVNVVNSSNTLVTSPVNITFNSPCFAAGEAIFKVNGLETNKTVSENGEATVTYQANGCVGTDNILATTTINGVSANASGSITIAPDTVQALQALSVSPALISLKGTGGQETASVKFKVTGISGAPVKGIDVDFTLNSTAGGLALTSPSAVTDAKGEVTAIVQAGTIPTNVNVTATARGSAVSTQSNELVVSTGIPDQNSMSLSVSVHNPSGWNIDGTEVDMTVRLADAFNNLVPDNTSVYFTTNGGAIPSSCKTTNGVCTVKWRSQNPRPSGAKVMIRATTQGNESFIDTNGNGYFDLGVDVFNTFNSGGDCDLNVPVSSAVSTDPARKPCDDLVEAYLDKNQSGKRDANEEFVDYNGNSIFDIENGIYNGVLCKTEGIGCTKTGITIRDEAMIVMSSINPDTSAGLLPGQDSNVVLGLGGTRTMNIILRDINGNSMPFGTKVTLTTSGVSNATVSHSLQVAGVPSTTEPTTFSITIKASETAPAKGIFFINVEAPGLTTITSGTTIN